MMLLQAEAARKKAALDAELLREKEERRAWLAEQERQKHAEEEEAARLKVAMVYTEVSTSKSCSMVVVCDCYD